MTQFKDINRLILMLWAGLFVILLPNNALALTFDFELVNGAVDNGATVTQTVGGVTLTATSTTLGADIGNIPDFGIPNLGSFTDHFVNKTIALGTFNTEPFVISFNQPVNVTSLDVTAFAAPDAIAMAYTFTPTGGGNAPVISAAIPATTSTNVALNWSSVTSFTVVRSDGIAVNPMIDNIIFATPNTAPTISGAVAGHAINDTATVAPFSTLTIVDANGDNVTVSVTLDLAAKGVFTPASLTASGFIDATGGVYTLALTTPALAQAAIRQLVYSPTTARVLPTLSETTTFSIAVSDGALTTTNTTTTVISTNNNIPDTTPPVVTAPDPITLVGNGVLGGVLVADSNIVAFLATATAVDNKDGNITPTNDAPALFGNTTATTVTFSATDVATNTGTASAIVTINDPNGTGGNALAPSGTGLTINQSTTLGIDPNATTTDTDGDGLSDIIEVGNPVLPLDADGDGVANVFEAGADATNASIASGMPAGNSTVSIVSTGQTITNAAPSAAGGTPPANTFFPFGIVNYQTTAPAGAYTVSLMLGSTISATGLSVYMVKAGVYTALPAWSLISGTQIDLTLTDGTASDLDATVNGVIVNSIGIGFLNTAPVFTGTPAISGTAVVGNTLSLINIGTHDADGDPVTLSYQWQSGGTNIAGATGPIYTPTSAEAHTNISCVITATDNRGGSVTATTAGIAMGNSAPTFTGTPVIGGIASIGNTLMLSNTGTSDTDGDTVVLTYQWQADGVNIVGATTAGYTLLAADFGSLITCNITADDGQAALNSTITTTTASVTAIDNTPPVVVAPANITMEATSATTAVTLGSATVTDNVDAGLTATASSTGPFAVGIHSVIWSATDLSANTGTAVQTVTITDTTAPVITVTGSTSITITQGTAYTDAGATALDIVDGNISGSITVSGTVNVATPGAYVLLYTVSDAAGNLGVAVRSVVVTNTSGGVLPGADTTAPVITLLGNASVTLTQGAAFTDAGATALDNVDGDISGSIIVSGTVNVATPGAYVLLYTVSDAAGNLGVAVRSVLVTTVSTTPVVAAASGGGCVILPDAEFDPIFPVMLLLLAGAMRFRKKKNHKKEAE